MADHDSTPEKDGKFAVQASGFTEDIYIGRLNKARTMFLDKETHTDMVLGVVAQYVERNFNGGMVADFPGLGLVLEIKVRPISRPGEGGSQ